MAMNFRIAGLFVWQVISKDENTKNDKRQGDACDQGLLAVIVSKMTAIG
jgi:hypothetical protein